MSEQLKQELEADTDRLETETVADSETIGEQEKEPTEGKLENQEGNESKEEDTVPMGKSSLADIVSGIPAPTEEEVKAAEAENAKSVKQKAREKLEAEKKKATQKSFADPVIAYLIKRCEEDQGLAEDVMQEGKTWKKCFDYIVEQARKQSNGRSTAVEDHVVYEWAEDYYHKEDKPEPVKKENVKKPTAQKSASKPSAKKSKPETEAVPKEKKEMPVSEWAGNEVAEWADRKLKQDAQKAEKKEKSKKKETPKKTEKPAMEGQMSLFDLL